jgi:hypothetical protein
MKGKDMQMKNYTIILLLVGSNLFGAIVGKQKRRATIVQDSIDRGLPMIRTARRQSATTRRQSVYDRNGHRMGHMHTRFESVAATAKKKRTMGFFQKKSTLELEAEKLELLNQLDDEKRRVKDAAHATRLLRIEFIAKEKKLLPEIERLQRQINSKRSSWLRDKTVRARRASLGDSVGY